MSRSRLLSAPRSFLFSSGGSRLASGIRLGFKPITGNDSKTGCIDQASYFMDVTDIHERRIMITFHNSGPDTCLISDIFFTDGGTFSISVQGVKHLDEIKGPGCYIACVTDNCQVAPAPYHDSSNYQVVKSSPNHVASAPLLDGIRRNESLGIMFDLQAGVTLPDVINALSKGNLNISVKVQGGGQGDGGIFMNESSLGLSPG